MFSSCPLEGNIERNGFKVSGCREEGKRGKHDVGVGWVNMPGIKIFNKYITSIIPCIKFGITIRSDVSAGTAGQVYHTERANGESQTGTKIN